MDVYQEPACVADLIVMADMSLPKKYEAIQGRFVVCAGSER
jgi:hypothetical protein